MAKKKTKTLKHFFFGAWAMFTLALGGGLYFTAPAFLHVKGLTLATSGNEQFAGAFPVYDAPMEKLSHE